MFVLAACGTGGGASISTVIDNPTVASQELDTTAFNPIETDETDTSAAIFSEATITAEEDVTVEYDETVKVVISINTTRTNLTESTVTEVTGTVTKTYIDTNQITTTYSSYRNDVVTYRRVDKKQTYSDGLEITTEGTPTLIATITGTIVEHDVTNSDPVLISHVLVSTEDSGDNIVNVSYTDTDTNLGTKTTGLTTNPDEFLTAEVRGYCGSWQGCTLDNLTVWIADDLANGTGTSYQHIETAGINDAWARGWTGKGVNIGIIDTGVNINHNELDGQIGGVYNNSSTDWNGHGTHVAGTIVAKRDGQGMVGVAFDSKLYVVRSPRHLQIFITY
jgi:subtilisin family serine protease